MVSRMVLDVSLNIYDMYMYYSGTQINFGNSYSQGAVTEYSSCSFAGAGTTKCKNAEEICIMPAEECDGVPQCPGATDEELSKCEKYFPPTADFQCELPDIGNNLSITIKATRCNGIKECAHGLDEEDCPKTFLKTTVVLSIFFAIFLFSASFTIGLTKLTEVPDDLPDLVHLSDNEVVDLLIKNQGTKNGKRIAKTLYQRYLQRLDGNHAKVVCELKVSLFKVNEISKKQQLSNEILAKLGPLHYVICYRNLEAFGL